MKWNAVFIFIPEENLCLKGNGGCHHYCHYQNKSVTCSCAAGFALHADGRTCEGIRKIFIFPGIVSYKIAFILK